MLAAQIAHAACPSSGVVMIVLASPCMYSCFAVNRTTTFGFLESMEDSHWGKTWSVPDYNRPKGKPSPIFHGNHQCRGCVLQLLMHTATIACCWITPCRCWWSVASVVGPRNAAMPREKPFFSVCHHQDWIVARISTPRRSPSNGRSNTVPAAR